MKINLKQFTFLLSIILLTSSFGFAQNGYEVFVGQYTLNKMDSTVFVLEVNRALEKDVISSWEKLVEENKGKAEVVDNNLTILNAKIAKLNDKPVDVYSSVTQEKGSVKLYTVFIVDSVRVDPNGTDESVEKVRSVLSDFGEKLFRDVLVRELSEKEEALVNLTDEREKKLKTKDKLVKSIQKDSLNISTSTTELGLLEEQLLSANTAYSAKKSTISSTNYADKDEAKVAKGELKELDKNRKGIEKEVQKHTDSILDSKANIRDYLYELNELKDNLGVVDTSILEQKTIVKEAQEELQSYPN